MQDELNYVGHFATFAKIPIIQYDAPELNIKSKIDYQNYYNSNVIYEDEDNDEDNGKRLS